MAACRNRFLFSKTIRSIDRRVTSGPGAMTQFEHSPDEPERTGKPADAEDLKSIGRGWLSPLQDVAHQKDERNQAQGS